MTDVQEQEYKRLKSLGDYHGMNQHLRERIRNGKTLLNRIRACLKEKPGVVIFKEEKQDYEKPIVRGGGVMLKISNIVQWYNIWIYTKDKVLQNEQDFREFMPEEFIPGEKNPDAIAGTRPPGFLILGQVCTEPMGMEMITYTRDILDPSWELKPDSTQESTIVELLRVIAIRPVMSEKFATDVVPHYKFQDDLYLMIPHDIMDQYRE